MISILKHELESLLKQNGFVVSYREVTSPDDLSLIVNEGQLKAVGYLIVPEKITKDGKFIHNISLYILDKSDNSPEIISSTIDTSLSVADFIRRKASFAYGDLSINTSYIKSEENDSVGVMMEVNMKGIGYGLQ